MQLIVGPVLALALTVVACQAPPPPRPAVKTTAALAAEALDRGHYAEAADLYRRALAAEPESLPLHYGLGVAASHLDRRADAIREFTWVLAHAEATSSEATTARRWLEAVGALRRPAVATSARDESPEPRDAAAQQEPGAAPAALQGRVVLDEPAGRVAPAKRMQLLLSSYPDRLVYLRLRTDEDGRFRFTNVPPGTYRLTDAVAGQPRWRLRVELTPGQDAILDLDPTNSTRVRDDFPDPAPAATTPSS